MLLDHFNEQASRKHILCKNLVVGEAYYISYLWFLESPFTAGITNKRIKDKDT